MSRGRRITLPNVVMSKNITFYCQAVLPIDFGKLADASAPIACERQLFTDCFFVTFSTVSSSFNGEDVVAYREVILKIPVVIGTRSFIFPPRTYVDNELSLIRGYQLGFNKYMAAIDGTARDQLVFEEVGFRIEAMMRSDGLTERIEALDALTDPFILSENGAAVELVVTDYHRCVDSGWIAADGNGEVVDSSFVVKACRCVEDSFVIHGTRRVLDA